ncbi:MAG: response regulator transcription factor [Sinobacteraceae bacterium]|nr:response regulator transcription factor [Nevskiaceae bacterium]
MYVVDDALAVRDSLRSMLEAADLQVETYPSAEAFLAAYRTGQPGCLLLDVKLPGVSGLDLQAALQQRNVHLPIIFLTAHANIKASVRAIRAGAIDFLVKPTSGAEVLDRVQMALALNDEAQALHPGEVAADTMHTLLSPREREVVELVTAGLSNKEIGRKLRISHRTVEVHRARLRKKTSARSIVDLVRVADALRFQLRSGELG